MIAIAQNIIKEALDEGIHLFVESGKLGFKQSKDGRFSDELKQRIIDNKAGIVAFLSDYAPAKVDRRNAVPKVDREKHAIPLSFAQQRLWLLSRIDGGSAHYNMPAALTLNGTLNMDALKRAFSTIVERHESIRTCFNTGDDGQAIPVLKTTDAFQIDVHDLSQLDPDERARQQAHYVQQEASQEFDFEKDFTLKVKLLILSQQRYVLLVTMHHIASDGWSMGILINEFSTLYTAYNAKEENPLPPFEIQYGDFAHWQRNWLQGEVLEEQFGYWTKQLANLPVVHSLPLDRPRPLVQSFVGETYFSRVNSQQAEALNQYCQKSGATLFMGLHTLFSVLLSRFSNETDIVMGTAVANREQSEVAGLIGFFVNSLVLRSDLSAPLSFAQMLAQSKTLLLDAYAHQQVPFEQVVDKMQPERTMGHSPMFQIMLVLQNTEEGTLSIPGISLEPVKRKSTIAKYDLTFNITQGDDGLTIGWEYNIDLFDKQTIEQMAKGFNFLLEQMLNDPSASVMTTKLLDSKGEEAQLVQWNEVHTQTPNLCLQQLFELCVQSQPTAPALLFDVDQPMSYEQLNEQANRLAHYLVEHKKVTPDTLVGVYIERSQAMIIAILAIIKAGGAYVPLDPEHPATRLNYIIEDSDIGVVLCTQKVASNSVIARDLLLCIDDESICQQLMACCADDIIPKTLGLTPDNLAYVVYTSGSTGKPKGVMVSHANVVPLVRNSNYFEFGSHNAIAQASNMSFDAMTFELWGALLNGGKLVYISKDSLLNPTHLQQLINKLNINTLFITTALFNLIAQDCPSALSQLDTLLFGGEDCSKRAVELILTHGAPKRLLHMYGPTENTTYTLYKPLTMADVTNPQKVALGKGLSNNTVYVLDQHRQAVPVGVVGELYLGGPGVARGYMNREELTQSAFIDNPFRSEADPSPRLYKTGDLVRYRSDGNLEFAGRIDHQVKIRGFRIELGEIEHALVAMNEISEAFVIARQEQNQTKSLIAYLVPSEGVSDDPDTRHRLVELVRQNMQQNLPDYMVPAMFILLEALPLTSNGKVDRKALPEPDFSEQQTKYIAPTNDAEVALCKVWAQVLGAHKVGIEDNFFDLGGNSLSMIQMISAAKKEQLVIEVGDVWKYQTVASLAALLDKRSQNDKSDSGNVKQVHVSKLEPNVSQFVVPYTFNETLVRLAVNKLLSEPSLQYHVSLSSGTSQAQWLLSPVKRNRKEIKALWSIENKGQEHTQQDLASLAEGLNGQVMSEAKMPIGLRWVDQGQQQSCLLAAHPALVEKPVWQKLVHDLHQHMISLYTQEH